MTTTYRLIGGLGSPYTMKLRAIMRYRRLPHVFEMRNGKVKEEVAHVRPQLIPMLQLPDSKEWRVDSTPIAMELEQRHPNERSIIPDDEATAFLSALIEDFGDEWLTKAMFHYRWYYAADRDYAMHWIAADQVRAADGGAHARQQFAEQICERQVSRMALVGCTDENRPAIERTYELVLDALSPYVAFGAFLFGSRPALADFGLFGQLKTLSDDPTGQQVMRQRAQTVSHWIRQVDDLSGIEGEWRNQDEPVLPVVTQLLEVCGQTYLPFLAANAQAQMDGAEEVRLEIFDHPFAQAPFAYQAKCYSKLRSQFEKLSTGARQRLEPVLEATDCLKWLA